MSSFFLIALIVLLLWVLMGAPIGKITLQRSINVATSSDRVWQAVFPFGSEFNWNGAAVNIHKRDCSEGEITTSSEGRDGQPIKRGFRLSKVEDGHSFVMQYTSDTALAQQFWADYEMRTQLESTAADSSHTKVTFEETDHYKGLAFAIYRFFALRRHAKKLKRWAETGHYKPGGVFEHPATQLGMAVFSALLIWPFFSLTQHGFVMACILTLVVALHEYGHMIAFKLSGHKNARMIFLPLLGGMALGSRPYDRHFEVAFSAMMGAGFSIFALWIAIWLTPYFDTLGQPITGYVTFFILICGMFNLANLLPIWRFDGGQVLRQVFRQPASLTIASAFVLALFIGAGWIAGLSLPYLLGASFVVLALSILTGSTGVRPKKPLTPMTTQERFATVSALAAVLVSHTVGALWALDKIIA